MPDGEAKSKGIKLGQEVAAKILEMREKDGASAADAYRPKTKPGVYIPTPITVGWQFANDDALRLDEPVAIPTEASAVAQERAMGERL